MHLRSRTEDSVLESFLNSIGISSEVWLEEKGVLGGWFMFTLPPQREEHCVADPGALHWPSSLPEEVSAGPAGVLPEVWKSPHPFPSEIAPRS